VLINWYNVWPGQRWCCMRWNK